MVEVGPGWGRIPTLSEFKMTRATGFSLFLLALLSLLNLAGCDPTQGIDEATVEESSGRLVAESLGYERGEVELEWQAGDLTEADSDAVASDELSEQDPECYWTRAYVTVQGVTTVDTVLVCGPVAFARLPRVPATLGMPFTVRLLDGTTYTGTIQ